MCQYELEFVSPECDLQDPPKETGEVVVSTEPNLAEYDRIVLFFSGGKDSVAAFLYLLSIGYPIEKIELHHHDVDGRESDLHFMDWPVTTAYCQAFAKAFKVRLITSWKEGGFEREMLRHESRTAPIKWETEDGSIMSVGGEGGKLGTRQRFPQVAADLRVRWCSAYLKVDVGAGLLTTEPRFREGKTLVITGERAQESSNRARYKTFEPHRSDNRNGARVQRWIDHWRPIHGWTEEQVWEILRRYNVNPHPAYHLGWGRTSCVNCIFGSCNQWASARAVVPQQFGEVANYEKQFNVTIHRKLSVIEQADKGVPYAAITPELVALANSKTYLSEDIFVKGEWKLPAGAFSESTGPV